jgi:hypothetical protein
MAGGSEHEHITNLRCVDDAGKAWDYQVNQLVTYIKTNGDTSVWCAGTGGDESAWVIVRSNGYLEYVQTKADGLWSNNLLALPLY